MFVKVIAKKILQPVISCRERMKLPRAAKLQDRVDSAGVPSTDPGIDKVAEEGMAWLSRAQDRSTSHDGGVARHFSLISGWGSSYPETTGYIVPTFIDWYKHSGDPDARARAKRMLDWLKLIQFEEGGFQGGLIDAQPCVPVTFNTGQILLGLAAGVAEFGGDYHPSMKKASDWLRDSLDHDGAWRRFPTPFAAPGEKAYEPHVAWGLMEADRILPRQGYGDAALKNVDWSLTKQRPNGWFEDCRLTDEGAPPTHTIGYAMRGILEAWRLSENEKYLHSAKICGDGILQAMGSSDWLPGELDDEWCGTVKWVCLTGNSQIAHCLLLLYQALGDERYLEAGKRLNAFVRRTIDIAGPEETRGAVKGSFPVSGSYGAYEYLNWAVKFTVDSNMLERSILA